MAKASSLEESVNTITKKLNLKEETLRMKEELEE
jgi:hypothetical protein